MIMFRRSRALWGVLFCLPLLAVECMYEPFGKSNTGSNRIQFYADGEYVHFSYSDLFQGPDVTAELAGTDTVKISARMQNSKHTFMEISVPLKDMDNSEFYLESYVIQSISVCPDNGVLDYDGDARLYKGENTVLTMTHWDAELGILSAEFSFDIYEERPTGLQKRVEITDGYFDVSYK